MPGSDTPVADLWPQLSSLLLRTLGWTLLAAVLLGGTAYLLARRHPGRTAAIRTTLFGSAAGRESLDRRFLRIAFGLLWIADGLLQAQPLMPSGFAMNYLSADRGPGWFMSAQGTLARAWMRHPVAADVAAVWLEIGLGLVLLLGGWGVLAKIGAWTSIGWGLVVWFFGGSIGGLVASGSGWLTGGPGAGLVYVIAGAALLLPWTWWQTGRACTLLRRAGAAWLAVAALLTALPGERFWTPAGLARPFADGLATNPSAVLRAPMRQLASLAVQSPHLLNGIVVGVLVVLALALWASGRALVVGAAMVWCLATWWLGQDFGVLGGTATDPNTALPLALLFGATLPVWRATPVAEPAHPAEEPRERSARSWRVAVLGAISVVALALTIVVPTVLAAGVGTPADASAIAANSNGGLTRLPGRPLPRFALFDQRGVPTSTAALHGKVVVLTFLDPVCTSDCPVIGAQLGMADRRLGPLSQHAEFIALDTNPVFRHRADVAAFTASHYLGGLPNWHFLWGSRAQMQQLFADFGVSVDVPTVGMIQHSEALYFADPDGRIVGYLDDGAASELTSTYAQQIRSEIQALLR
jgi:cytochrome oxidase Cu insertion factor (SCO1/SenC/PrrC family)